MEKFYPASEVFPFYLGNMIKIPNNVYRDPELTLQAKFLIAHIYSLETEAHGCTASNAELAAYHNTGIGTIEKTLRSLRKLGWVYTESFDGRVRSVRVNRAKYRGK